MEALLPDYTFFIHMGLFLVAYMVIDRVLFRPYLALLAERDRLSFAAGDDLEELEVEARQMEDRIQTALEEARREGSETRERLMREASESAQATIEAAQESAKNEVDKARRELHARRAEIISELESEIEPLAESIRKRLLERAA